MQKILRFLLPVLIIAAGIGGLQWLKATRPHQEPPQVQERVWRVEVERAQPARLAPELVLYGRVETPDLLRTAASAAAWVEEVAVRDGDIVRQGDLLIRLDRRDFEPRIAQARAEISELDAQIESERNRAETDKLALAQEQRLLALARAGVERQQRLKSQKVGAEQALDEAEQAEAMQALAVSGREMSIADHPSRLQALQARLQRAKSRLDELQLEYERATVKAPYDGVVSRVAVTVGDQVAKGSVLVELYALDSLEVRARIPAPYQAELIGELAADNPMQATADVGGRRVELQLVRLAGEAAPSGVDALFRVTEDPALLRLGQMLTLRLERPARENSLAVPFRAVYGGGRLYKLVDGRMRGVDVETLGGRIGEDGTERLLVRSPELRAGDLIVVTHMPNAVDGLRVETVGEPTVADAAGRGIPAAVNGAPPRQAAQ